MLLLLLLVSVPVHGRQVGRRNGRQAATGQQVGKIGCC